MNTAAAIAAIALPPDACVDQRATKKLLLEHGAPTAADKRAIQDGIEEMIWVAALKPTNIAVSVFRDEVREYLEIAVLHLTLRTGAKGTRLVEMTDTTYAEGHEGDIQMVNEWANFLGLTEWFGWGGFEDVPEDYLR